jgi:hypothetical protein
MTGISRLINQLSPATALLYLAGRALARFGDAVALHDLLLYVQPVRATPLLPPQRGASIEVRVLDGDAALASGLPCPPEHAAARRRGGVHCLAAYSGGALIGFHWIALGPYDDEMVRCRYQPLPDGASAWSFDLRIEPAHRGGFAYARLADATAALLRGHGRTHVASYVEAYNRGAVAAEERLGGRRIGRAVHLRLGPLQLLLASVAPYLHLSLSRRDLPVVRIGEAEPRRFFRKHSYVFRRLSYVSMASSAEAEAVWPVVVAAL